MSESVATATRFEARWATRLRWQAKRFSNLHIQGPQPNIFVFATARSGSTWLMELLATQPAIKFIDEPLNIKHFQAGGGPLPASWEFLLPHPGREPAIERYFDDLIHNRIGVGAPPPLSPFHRTLSRRLVFKILRCTDLMNWFEERFGAKIVYLVRHPLATAVSRERFGRGPLFVANDAYCERFLTPAQRQLARDVFADGTELEQKIADWALQNLPPLRFLDRSRWLCLHYEDIVMRPEDVVRRIAAELVLPQPERMLRQVGQASKTAAKSDAVTQQYLQQAAEAEDRSFLLHKWRNKITPDEESRAFALLDAFGIDTYAAGEDMPVNRA
jgi:hypothetical protein